MAKFEEIVKEWGVKPEDIVAASKRMEVRSSADTRLARDRRLAVRGEGKKLVDANLKKPKLGRALTVKAVQEAIAGKPQSRIVRGKLVRALNQLGKLKKKDKVDAIALFGEVNRRKGKAPVKKKAK